MEKVPEELMAGLQSMVFDIYKQNAEMPNLILVIDDSLPKGFTKMLGWRISVLTFNRLG